jgi:thiol-disulfide isomerase/thioredoxin
MRELAPRPILLVLTLILVVGAIIFIEFRLDAPGGDAAGARAGVDKQRQSDEKTEGKKQAGGEKKKQTSSGEKQERAVSDVERIASKEGQYPRAREITGSTGLINTDGVSLKDAAGEKVVLVEFWTYSCFNCQNAQPHINALYDEYKNDGLLVVGVHSPEFGFEKDISNVREAVRQANIRYPVVLDNDYAIWSAYGQRLIDADGFIRFRHFGEGSYNETEQKVRELLAERDRISG